MPDTKVKAPIAEYPYNEYRLYKVWHKGEGRYYAQFVHLETKKRHCIAYARYKMAVNLGRILEKWEQVDHKDENKVNDDIDNLQILTQVENTRKAAKHYGYDKRVLTICPICKIEFKCKRYKLKNDNKPCCSKQCGGSKSTQTLKKRDNKGEKYGEIEHGTRLGYQYYKCRW